MKKTILATICFGAVLLTGTPLQTADASQLQTAEITNQNEAIAQSQSVVDVSDMEYLNLYLDTGKFIKATAVGEYRNECWQALTGAYQEMDRLMNVSPGFMAMTQEQKNGSYQAVDAAMKVLDSYASFDDIQRLLDENKSLDQSLYTEDSWAAYSVARSQAVSVYYSLGRHVTAVERDDAFRQLTTATNNLTKKVIEPEIPIEKVDTQLLETRYFAARNLKENEFTQDSWINFRQVFKEAELMLNLVVTQGQASTQTAINEMDQRLEKAMTDLVRLSDIYKTKNDLSILLLDSNALKQADYTEDSWLVFQNVRNEAIHFNFSMEPATSEEITEMWYRLQAAIEQLEKI